MTDAAVSHDMIDNGPTICAAQSRCICGRSSCLSRGTTASFFRRPMRLMKASAGPTTFHIRSTFFPTAPRSRRSTRLVRKPTGWSRCSRRQSPVSRIIRSPSSCRRSRSPSATSARCRSSTLDTGSAMQSCVPRISPTTRRKPSGSSSTLATPAPLLSSRPPRWCSAPGIRATRKPSCRG